MKWRIYKHYCRFIHNVDDRPELVDKACLTPHQHGFDPNPPCVFEFIVGSDKWIDFKEIKVKAIKVIESLANSISEDPTDKIPYYDFGTQDTENLTDDLKKLLLIELQHISPVKVQIWLDETRKYSIWDDGSS